MNRTTKSGAVVRSICSTVKKMMVGVKVGYRYKVRLVYAHFPINAKITKDSSNVDNKIVEIRNFLGEKIVRRCEMIGEHTLVKMGDLRDELWIEGIDLRDVSQSGKLFFSFFSLTTSTILDFLVSLRILVKVSQS